MNIKELIETNCKNLHHARRYLRFIQYRQTRILPSDTYTESHHVLPKSEFPEFRDFKIHPWNRIDLTAREHFIAHVILWKAFGGSQATALVCMLEGFNADTCSSLSNRKVPPAIKIRYLAKAREESSEHRSGWASYKDQIGNRFFLHANDPKISELGLVGLNYGISPSPEAIDRHKKTKALNRKVMLYFLNLKKKICVTDPQYNEFISQGWRESYLEIDKKYTQFLVNESNSKRMKGTVRYCTPDGKYYKRLDRNHPDVLRLQLVPQVTDKQRAQQSSIGKLGSERNKGTKIYNNGKVEKKFHEDPGESWKLGRLPRSVEHSEKQRNGHSAKMTGTMIINDGVSNLRIRKEDLIPDGYVKGMLRRRGQ